MRTMLIGIVLVLLFVTGCSAASSTTLTPEPPPAIVLPATSANPPKQVPDVWLGMGQCATFIQEKTGYRLEVCYYKIVDRTTFVVSINDVNAILATEYQECEDNVPIIVDGCKALYYGLRYNFFGRAPIKKGETSWWLGITAPPEWHLANQDAQITKEEQ